MGDEELKGIWVAVLKELNAPTLSVESEMGLSRFPREVMVATEARAAHNDRFLSVGLSTSEGHPRCC